MRSGSKSLCTEGLGGHVKEVINNINIKKTLEVCQMMWSWCPDTCSECWTPKAKKLLCISLTTYSRLWLYKIWLQRFCISSKCTSRHYSNVLSLYVFTCKVPLLLGQEDLVKEGTSTNQPSKRKQNGFRLLGCLVKKCTWWKQYHSKELDPSWVWHSIPPLWLLSYLFLKMFEYMTVSPRRTSHIYIWLTVFYWSIIYRL